MIDEAMKGESFVVDRLETRQMVDDRQMSLFWLCCASSSSSFFFFLNRIEHGLETIVWKYIYFSILIFYMVKLFLYLFIVVVVTQRVT